MITQYLTCKFKLHNPSAHKRAVMDYALEQYTRGYSELLKYAQDNLQHIEDNGLYRDKYTAKSIGSLLPRPACDIHSSAKDSLVQDVAGNLASYFELVGMDGKTWFPIGRDPSPGADIEALNHFVHVGGNQEDFDQSQARYLKNAKASVMPVYFCRSDGAAQTRSGAARNRNFSLLTNAKRDKLLAALWLLPARHALCKPLDAKQGNLVKIDSGELFASNSQTAILVPLQIGRNGWQEQKFLDAAVSDSGNVKTAFLVRNDRTGEYFLHISFEFICPKPYEPEAFLGIDRGVFFSMAYAVVDGQGDILVMDHEEDGFRDSAIGAGKRVQEKQRAGRKVTMRDWRCKEREMILHRLVNRAVEVAKEHKAMIVTEDLNIQIRGKFYKSAWEKMYRFLEYKCRLEGVPLWRGGIWAAYSSQICIYCGELNKERKRDGSPFDCPSCGAVYHSDEGAGVNIARRALYKKKEWESRGGYRAFHRSFAKGERLTTENSLRQVEVSRPGAGRYVYHQTALCGF